MAIKTFNWREVVSDPTESKVLESLQDPVWDFRTVEGIAGSTGVNRETVESVLEKYRDSWIGESAVPDHRGRRLFYLSHRDPRRKFWSQLRLHITRSTEEK